MNYKSVAYQIIIDQIAELRAIIARANGLLNHEEEEPQVNGFSTAVARSTYSRDIILPEYHHDNDNTGITTIKILPNWR